MQAGRPDPRLIFSRKANDYAAARPDYPKALFVALKAICPPGERVVVADVGTGTGLLTQGLLQTGYHWQAGRTLTQSIDTFHEKVPKWYGRKSKTPPSAIVASTLQRAIQFL